MDKALHQFHFPVERILFEALETLALGIRVKMALWQVLPVIREIDPRIPEDDFEVLASRAEEQYDRVEQHWLQLAPTTFRLVSK